MKAWRVGSLGEPEQVLSLEDVPDPIPGPDQAVVAVDAVALNFPDVLLCRGHYQVKPPLPFTPGIELAGTVLDAGGTTTSAGTRVLVSPTLPDGGLAEQVAVAGSAMLALPDAVPAHDGAALLITYQTGWVGLRRRARLAPGETLLVHAGAGGVGTAAIQLGLAFGARVIATAGGPEKVALCRELGAELAIDYRSEDFVAAVKDATNGRGADVIFDPVGGEVFTRSTKCIAFEGRLLVIGFAGGEIPAIPAGHALVKNYSVLGLHWGLYRLMEPELIPHVHDELIGLYQAGQIRPVVQVRPFEQAPTELARLAARGTVGKVVLTGS